MNKLLHFLLGYISIRLHGNGALRAVNLLNDQKYGFWGLRITDDGYSISCYVSDADSIIATLDTAAVEYSVVKRAGLPFAVYAYRKRLGLLVGAALAMSIVYASTCVFWDIRLECNGEYDSKQVLASLKELDLYQGANIKSLNVPRAELQFLVNNPHFSDIAINVQGTVAVVKLRVRTQGTRQEEKTGAYNVTAAESGIIHSVTAIKGVPTVKKGDTVAEGDTLITGVMQGAYGEYYIHHAHGSVTATVYREFTVIIPLKSTEKVYTGKTQQKTAYTVLGKRFNMFKTEYSSFAAADVETTVSSVSIMGASLPITKERLTYKEYVIKPVELTKDKAESQAIAAFDAFIKRELNGEVTNQRYECVYSEELDAVVLNGTVELITEIGVETPMQDFPPDTTPTQQS